MQITKPIICELILRERSLRLSVEKNLPTIASAIAGLVTTLANISPESAIEVIQQLNDQIPDIEDLIEKKQLNHAKNFNSINDEIELVTE